MEAEAAAGLKRHRMAARTGMRDKLVHTKADSKEAADSSERDGKRQRDTSSTQVDEKVREKLNKQQGASLRRSVVYLSVFHLVLICNINQQFSQSTPRTHNHIHQQLLHTQCHNRLLSLSQPLSVCTC